MKGCIFMKKKIILLILCITLLFSVCGCNKEDNKNNNLSDNKNPITEKTETKEENKEENNINTNENDKIKDSAIKEDENKQEERPTSSNNNNNSNNNTTTNDKKQETTTNQETTTSKEDTTTNNNNTNKEEEKEIIDTPKEELITPPKEELNKKIVVCSISQTGSNYSAITKLTTTFENNTIVYHTMYIEKAFNDGYKAEEDKAFEGITNERLNNLNDGRNGTIYITNNTIYYTLNFDVKNYPSIISYITTHTEYNDFLNHMTTNNGYSCITK